MKIYVCDYCKRSISDKDEYTLTIVVTKEGRFGPEQMNLDICMTCASEKMLLKSKEVTHVPSGQLTPEELSKIMEEADGQVGQ